MNLLDKNRDLESKMTDSYDESGNYFSNKKVRGSNLKIHKELDKAYDFQDQRVGKEIEKNTIYKRELDIISKQIEESSPESSKKDKARQKQITREHKLAEEKFNENPGFNRISELECSQRALIREKQGNREEEIIEKQYFINKYDQDGESSLISKRSLMSEMANSLKESSKENQRKLMGGFESLEDKINRLEKDLDHRLNDGYISNQELVKRISEKPKNNEIDDELSESDSESKLDSDSDSDLREIISKKVRDKKLKSANEFKKVFTKEEKTIQQKKNKISSHLKNSSIKNSSSDADQDNNESLNISKDNLIELELEKLKEENQRIKQELQNLKEKKPISKKILNRKASKQENSYVKENDFDNSPKKEKIVAKSNIAQKVTHNENHDRVNDFEYLIKREKSGTKPYIAQEILHDENLL